MKARSIFEVYPHEYDLMTNVAAREKRHALEVDALIDRFHPTAVLDAGCATGLTTRLFARRGVTAVGLDRSRRMIRQARQNPADVGRPLTFRVGSFEKLPVSFENAFDLVVCLANSIVGVETKTGLGRAMRGFLRVLKPGGALVVQGLNQEAVEEGVLFPVRATRNDAIIYLRMTRRRGRQGELIAIRLDLSVDPPRFEPFLHEFDTFTRAELCSAFETAGFRSIRTYSDLLLSRPFRVSSRDIVIVARRPDK